MQRYGRNAALSKTSDLGRTGRTGRPGPTAGFKGDGFVMTRLVTKHVLADSVTSDHEGKNKPVASGGSRLAGRHVLYRFVFCMIERACGSNSLPRTRKVLAMH